MRMGVTLQCITVVALASISSALVINTPYGRIEGKQVTTAGTNDVPAYAFLGIPYAAPPVGELRFKPPAPPSPWTGTKDGTQYGNMCPMMVPNLPNNLPKFPFASLKMSEDCLYLNVFAPEPRQNADPRAVMVYIHGGGFTAGTGAFFDGRVYATRHGVILVTINYRLGLLGFMTMVNEHLPANNGLLDQIAALRWVNDNIAAFGGDPKKVTIFGESAGSLSVNFHVFSPSSVTSNGEALFRSAIYQSGALSYCTTLQTNTSISRWAATEVAKYIGCPNTSVEMVQCLRNLSLRTILSTSLPWALVEAISKPVVDGKHIPEDPATMMQKGNFKQDLDVILGVCNTEGFIFIPVVIPSDQWKVFKTAHFAAHARIWLTLAGRSQWSDSKLDSLVKDVMKIYKADTYDDILRRHFVDFLGDLIIAYPTVQTALSHRDSGKGKTYLYEFYYKISTSIWPDYITADHSDDLLFTFGYSANNNGDFDIDAKYNTSDKQMDTIIPTYWANFAKTGNPNKPAQIEGLTEWKEFTGDDVMKLQLPPMMKKYDMERINFWTATYSPPSGSNPAASAATAMSILSMTLFALLIKE